MTTIPSKVCHHCCNPDHLGTCFGVSGGVAAAGGFFGVLAACIVKQTATGILSFGLGGGAIGAFAGASAVTTYYAKCNEDSGDSKSVVVDYEAYGQPSFTTRVVSKQPSWGGRGYGFNPDSSYYYDSYDAAGCSDGGGHGGCSDGGGHGGCSDAGGSGSGDC